MVRNQYLKQIMHATKLVNKKLLICLKIQAFENAHRFNLFGRRKSLYLTRRVARIWKRGGGGYFERVRSLQTTLTRIFIALESVSHGLSEN